LVTPFTYATHRFFPHFNAAATIFGKPFPLKQAPLGSCLSTRQGCLPPTEIQPPRIHRAHRAEQHEDEKAGAADLLDRRQKLQGTRQKQDRPGGPKKAEEPTTISKSPGATFRTRTTK